MCAKNSELVLYLVISIFTANKVRLTSIFQRWPYILKKGTFYLALIILHNFMKRGGNNANKTTIKFTAESS